MTIVKQEQQELEARIHLNAPDPGVQAIRQWCVSAREALNAAWPRMSGEPLMQAQGYAGNLNELIRIIDHGPKLPRQEPKPQGGTK